MLEVMDWCYENCENYGNCGGKPVSKSGACWWRENVARNFKRSGGRCTEKQ